MAASCAFQHPAYPPPTRHAELESANWAHHTQNTSFDANDLSFVTREYSSLSCPSLPHGSARILPLSGAAASSPRARALLDVHQGGMVGTDRRVVARENPRPLAIESYPLRRGPEES